MEQMLNLRKSSSVNLVGERIIDLSKEKGINLKSHIVGDKLNLSSLVEELKGNIEESLLSEIHNVFQ